MALFFVFLLLKNQNADQGRMVKIVIGALTFFGLFIAVLKSVSKTEREKIVFLAGSLYFSWRNYLAVLNNSRGFRF